MNTTSVLKALENYGGSHTARGQQELPRALSARRDYTGRSAVRALAELTFLNAISLTRGGCFEPRLNQVAQTLLDQAKQEGVITKAMLAQMEEALASFAPIAREYTAHMVGHAHIDMNWMWAYHETVATTVETLRSALRLMDEYPAMTFGQSQASVYKILEEYAPDLLDKVRQYIREGRWEVTASTWVEGDKNMASGESQCRQILLTKQYLSKLLNIDPATLRLDYEPDTFGHNRHVPTVLRAGGVDRMYHCRGCDPRGLYRWRAPSGDEVLVYQEPKWYITIMDPMTLADYPTFCARTGDGSGRDFLVVYGVGDHGGGPTRRDVETILDMQTWPLFPKVEFSTYDRFYTAAEKLWDSLPVYEGELNFVFDGCYTSQSRLKMANSLAEKRLYDAEAFAAMAQLPDAHGPLAQGWENTLFNQFHDILPGSCTIDSREWAMGRFQNALAAANTAANRSLTAMASDIDTSTIPFDEAPLSFADGGGVGYHMSNTHLYPFSFTERGRGAVRAWHIFNPTRYEREEFVRIRVWDYPGDILDTRLADTSGNTLEWAVSDRDAGWMHDTVTLRVKVKVPAFGYTTCILQPAEPSDTLAFKEQLPNNPRQEHDMGNREYILENEALRARFDGITFALLSLKDKKSGRELVGGSATGCFQLAEEDTVRGMGSWRVGPAMDQINLNKTCRTHLKAYRADKYCSALEYEIPFRASRLTVCVTLSGNDRYLDYSVTADWLEPGTKECIPSLRFLAEPGYAAASYRYTAGSGTVIREALPHDVPSLGSMEFLPRDKTDAFLALFGDYQYGFRGCPGNSGVQLIRSSNDPDPYPELHRHHLHLYLGAAESEADARRMKTCIDHALAPLGAWSHSGSRGMSGQILNCDGECDVTALYENKKGHPSCGCSLLPAKPRPSVSA